MPKPPPPPFKFKKPPPAANPASLKRRDTLYRQKLNANRVGTRPPPPPARPSRSAFLAGKK